VLGLDLSRVRIVSGDSEVVPKDNGSYSSRVTFMVGNAAIDAARNLKSVLTAAAARKLDAGRRTSNAWASSIAPVRRTRARPSTRS
jgi:CO/xanthine dehydrogenase Mo-binding subunit